jgi:acyl-CoA synthetase (AMP-forming)/AMP-acid ligase II
MGDRVWHTPLSPLRFLERAVEVHPDAVSIVDGDRQVSYREFGAHATRLARALRAAGIGPGDRVAYCAPNVADLLVAHFGVPLAGAVLVAINTRLAPDEVRYICAHSGAKLLFVHPSLDAVAPPGLAAVRLETPEYERFLAGGSDQPLPWAVPDEDAPISINYTSGTTGRPKGVMYSHRGAYLNSLAEIVHSGFDQHSRYLWTLPMFHCNGWCTTWAVTAMAARHVCLRAVRGEAIWAALEREGITHLNGAPTVLTTIAADPGAHRLDTPLTVTTAGAPPSPTTIGQLEALGARVIHVYGLTETYGPYSVCEYQDGWLTLPASERAVLLARQGVGMLTADRLRVVDESMVDVPADGATMGEIVMRGNNVMLGYHDDPDATAQAFRGGWFHSGDLGVMQPDGYVKLLDRAKDVVISGGENISTVEVEQALLAHEAVLDVAVIGVPDERWGERPKAFVVLKPGASATEEELIEHVRGRLARFKAPGSVDFLAELPRTSTGKVRKFGLREREWAGHEARIQG